MRVVWAELASTALKSTSDYLFEEFGVQQQDEFLSDIEHLMMLLAANPRMGKIEPLLSGLSCTFRSIVVNSYNNKIIYTVDDGIIEIVDFLGHTPRPCYLADKVQVVCRVIFHPPLFPPSRSPRSRPAASVFNR